MKFQVFENALESFLQVESISLEDVAVALDDEVQKGKRGYCGSMLRSYAEFDGFMLMMNDVRSGIGVVFCPPLIDSNEDVVDIRVIGVGLKKAESKQANSEFPDEKAAKGSSSDSIYSDSKEYK